MTLCSRVSDDRPLTANLPEWMNYYDTEPDRRDSLQDLPHWNPAIMKLQQCSLASQIGAIASKV